MLSGNKETKNSYHFFQTYIIHLLLCNWYPHVQSNQEKQNKLLEMFNVNTKDTEQCH